MEIGFRRSHLSISCIMLLLLALFYGCRTPSPPLTPENYRAKISETRTKVSEEMDAFAEPWRNLLVGAISEKQYSEALEGTEKIFKDLSEDLAGTTPPAESSRRFQDIHDKYVRGLDDLVLALEELRDLPETDGKARELLLTRTRKRINVALGRMNQADESLESYFEKEAARERRRQEEAESDGE